MWSLRRDGYRAAHPLLTPPPRPRKSGRKQQSSGASASGSLSGSLLTDATEVNQRSRRRDETAAEFDLGTAAAPFEFFGLAGQRFGDEPQGFLPLWHAKIVALFENRTKIADGAELPVAIHFAGEPLALGGGIFEVELGVAAVKDPDHARGHLVSAAKGHEHRGDIFFVGATIAEGSQSAFEGGFIVGLKLHALANPVVECFDLAPGCFLAGCQLLGQGFEFRVGRFNQRAWSQMLLNILGWRFGNHE